VAVVVKHLPFILGRQVPVPKLEVKKFQVLFFQALFGTLAVSRFLAFSSAAATKVHHWAAIEF
jgi:hypothetical protein